MNRRRITAYAAAFVATLGFDGAFHAVRAACVGSVAVTSCTATCSANCFLQNDINCVSGQGINLASGANLDMCGRSIHCTSQFGCGSKPAVGMLASGSQVTNGLAGVQGTSPSKIDGGWEPAVNCAGYTSTKVTKIWVEGALTYGVQNCATVERNVFINNGIAAVVTSGVANSDQVDNNYFQGNGVGVYTSGDPFKITIDHNLFASNGNSGIEIGQSHTFDVNNNIFLGASALPVDDTTGLGTYTANYCDPDNPACTSCVSSGQCQPPTPPFLMP